MNKKYKKISIGLGVIILLVFGFLYKNNPQPVEAGVGNQPVEVLGSRTGTTTVYQYFSGTALANGTTSVPLFIGSDVDSAIFTINVGVASSTPGGFFTWNILGSNDAQCSTATTSTTMGGVVLKNQINWFNVDPTNSRSSGIITSASATGTVVTLKDLTWSCLSFEANGSSTAAWVQMRAKQLQ